jgi:hypothetical protein
VIKIPLRDLQSAVNNPGAYFRGRAHGGGGGGMGKTRYGMFQHAVFRFHRTQDLSDARAYLGEKFKLHFHKKGHAEYAERLDVYVRAFRNLHTNVVAIKDRIVVPLPQEFQNFVVSGQAARLDLAQPAGYKVWIFVRGKPDWEQDIRMPLLQWSYSRKLNAPMNEIEVGVYDFDAGAHSSAQYDDLRVKDAYARLKTLLRQYPGS